MKDMIQDERRLWLIEQLIAERDDLAGLEIPEGAEDQRLRESHFRCRTVSVGVRRAADFTGYSRQTTLRTPTCLTTDVANLAMGLIRANQPLDKEHAIRAIHVRTTNLVPMEQPVQDDLFGDAEDVHRRERLDLTIDELRRRFGNKCVHRTVELTDEAMGSLDIKRDNTVHPVGFLRQESVMVQGISGRVKRYVSVTARMDEDGRVRPLSIQWCDGQTYPVDDVLSVRRASSRRVGGDGICGSKIGDPS